MLIAEQFWDLMRSNDKFQKWQEHKVSYRCSLPSPLQKRSRDYKGLGGSASFELLSFLVNFRFFSFFLLLQWSPRWPSTTSRWPLTTPLWPPTDLPRPLIDLPRPLTDLSWPPIDLSWSPMIFSFSVLFFYLKISLLEMLIAVGNEHLKTGEKRSGWPLWGVGGWGGVGQPKRSAWPPFSQFLSLKGRPSLSWLALFSLSVRLFGRLHGGI